MLPGLAACAALAMLASQSPAAPRTPDFSGQWVLRTPAETAKSGVQPGTIEPVRGLTIGQTARSVTIEHARPGTHPKAGTHGFGSHGVVDGTGERFRADVFWLGDQLVIGSKSTRAPDPEGRTGTVEYSEMWSLDAMGRLVIECTEKQSGAVVMRKTLVYESKTRSRR